MNAISAYQQDSLLYTFGGIEHTNAVRGVEKDETTTQIQRHEKLNEIEDKAIISDEAVALYEAEQTRNTLNILENDKANDKKQAILTETKEINNENALTREINQEEKIEEKKFDKKVEELTQEEEQTVVKLKRIDSEVKAHEQAHKAAAAGLTTSAPSFEYEVGPDGEKYAVAGEVSISYRKSSDPHENYVNAQKLRNAALAPVDPSSTDKAVARQASADMAKAQEEIRAEQAEETNIEKENNNDKDTITKQEKTNTPDLLNKKAIEENNQLNISEQTVPINAAETAINPAAAPIFAFNKK